MWVVPREFFEFKIYRIIYIHCSINNVLHIDIITELLLRDDVTPIFDEAVSQNYTIDTHAKRRLWRYFKFKHINIRTILRAS